MGIELIAAIIGSTVGLASAIASVFGRFRFSKAEEELVSELRASRAQEMLAELEAADAETVERVRKEIQAMLSALEEAKRDLVEESLNQPSPLGRQRYVEKLVSEAAKPPRSPGEEGAGS